MAEEIKCDFCSSRPVTAAYHATDFIVLAVSQPMLVQESIGDWAACEICETLIDHNLWDKLVERAVKLFYIEHPEMHGQIPANVFKHMLTETYKQLRESNFRKGTL